ncbi:MAG: DNA-binding protein [Candidatus Omnitrophica bacterium]|nr:DNA-binding protein [Candidatus Omnitrophota bacterium]
MSKSRIAYSVLRIAFVIVVAILFTANCYAVVWSSNELIEKAKELNGRKLNYRGELVTTILNRGEYSWINLSDNFNAIGVWCKSSLLTGVKFAGDYKNRGDTIEVNGIFNRACSIHNGELDIHADTVKIVKKGYPVVRRMDLKRINSAAALFVFTILTVIVFRKRL